MKATFLGFAFGVWISLRGFAASGGGFVFVADSVAGDVGTQVIVPIRAVNFDSIISFQGTIGFDSAKLAFVSVQHMNLPSMGSGNFGLSYIANGRVTFSWNETNLTPITVPDSTELFAIVLQIIGQPGDQVPIPILNAPTPIEVVDWSYTPIGFSTVAGKVSINVPHICAIPDSLTTGAVSQTHADLSWYSGNPGATFSVEWGPWGFIPGNGIGTGSGTVTQGINHFTVTNLQAGTAYEFFVHEQCDSLNGVDAGPHGFATPAEPTVHPTVIVYADSVQGLQFQPVGMTIRAVHFTDILSAQGTVQWDPAVAVLDSVAAYGLPNMSISNFGLTQRANGIVSFSWNDPTLQGVSIPDSAAVFTLQMHLAGAPGTATPLAFPSIPVVMEFSDTSFAPIADSTINGQLKVSAPLSAHTVGDQAHIVVYPNPLILPAREFNLNTTSNRYAVLDISLLNPSGQVLRQALSWTTDGKEITCKIETPISEGLWFLRLETTEGNFFEKFMVNGR